MILPLTLLERAKQGDAGAIAALMNDVLRPQDVWVKATLDADCLQIMLKAPTVLDQATCVTFIRRGLLRLQPEIIAQVRAYAWRMGDAFPVWITAFSLKQPQLESQLNSTTEPALQKTGSGEHSTDHVSTSLKQSPPTPVLPSHAISKQRSELFNVGFVIALITVVYFAVAGV